MPKQLPKQPKLGRPRLGEERLDPERILEVALRLVDEQGMSAFSVRRLAAALEVDAMALYHYFPGKKAILAGVIEKVFREWEVPRPKDESWENRIRAFANAYRALARTHPSLVLELVADIESASLAASRADASLHPALKAGGLSTRQTIHAGGLIIDFLNGFALGERGVSPRDSSLSKAMDEQFRASLEIILLGIGLLGKRPEPQAS